MILKPKKTGFMPSAFYFFSKNLLRSAIPVYTFFHQKKLQMRQTLSKDCDNGHDVATNPQEVSAAIRHSFRRSAILRID